MGNRNKLETWGNETTMNLNNLVYSNIMTSPYFKALMEKTTYQELVDEIYYHVSYLDPFLKGSAPSSAFCLLYRCWLVKFTVNQLSAMVEHPDSPYIRAIGFLYIRYVCKPADLMDWFEPFFEDDEEIQLSKGSSTKTTIGEFCRQLLLEQKFLGTMLPRIPVLVQREIEAKIIPEPSSKERKDRSVYDQSSKGDKDRDYSRDRDRHSRYDDRKHRSSRRDDSREYDRRRDRDRYHGNDSRDRDYKKHGHSPSRDKDRDYYRSRDKYHGDRSDRSHRRDSKRSYSRSRSPNH